MAKKIVPEIEVRMVSKMLRLTSVSLAVSKTWCGVVLRNIPVSGAMINNSTRAPRSVKRRLIREREFNWQLTINDEQ